LIQLRSRQALKTGEKLFGEEAFSPVVSDADIFPDFRPSACPGEMSGYRS
jgi:hypothetical protein